MSISISLVELLTRLCWNGDLDVYHPRRLSGPLRRALLPWPLLRLQVAPVRPPTAERTHLGPDMDSLPFLQRLQRDIYPPEA
ncbi:hypothetical protein VTO42DRAFT_193 [Malbranchea cinnamomea]